jgi:hypothetical protein
VWDYIVVVDGCVGLYSGGGSATIYYTTGGPGETISTISGNRYCPSLTILYILNAGSYIEIDKSYASTYSFTIMEDHEYLIIFDAYNFYYFTAGETDLVRNYDNCEDQGDPGDPVDPGDPYNPNPNPVDTYIRLFFLDNCGNFMRNTSFEYCNHLETITCYAEDAPLGFFDIDFEDQEYLELWVNSAYGSLYYNITDPKCAGFLTYIILNPTISWNNNILVIDGNTSLLIEDALVSFYQDCIINPSATPPRHKYTDVNGIATFLQCELDSFSLGVSATNYQSFSDTISSASLNAFNLEQTTMVTLYPITDEENETTFNYTDYSTYVKFKDINDTYTSSILDTDAYVDLYYYNNNSEEASMTLKFQKYNIATGIIDLLSWNIPIDTEGYKRILKSNYTDVSYLYIGRLYNHTIDGWDRVEYLSVRNETSEIELDYENLSAHLWFFNKNPEGSIDYREDIEIIAYANSSYIGLLNISLELYDNSVFVTHTNLTWADFVTADLQWFYEWKPDHSYINGHNYTVRMYGYDYYLLEIDYVNATDYRKNKITIFVKDHLGNDLLNSFVFLEGYGSLSTGVFNYNSYESLEDGNYRYRATKSGYVGQGWEDITIADGDKDVIYILYASGVGESDVAPSKMSDDDLQSIYITIMAFLFIFILVGGFIYAAK